MIQKITPFLMFDGNLGEALNFYTSIFKDSKIVNISRLKPNEQEPEGKVRSATFVLEGQEFMAYDGGSYFKFSEGISFFVSCDSQEDVDRLYEQLSMGGEKQQCGWLKDQFGVSWQIIPNVLMELLNNKDPEVAKYAIEAMLKMKKIDIKGLKKQ